MTEKKQGAAEWLRGIIKEYEAEESTASCSKMAQLIAGIDCKSVACRDCQVLVMTSIADRIEAETDGLRNENERLRDMVREPQLPEGIEWPRFEDGELVKIGDEAEYGGKAWEVDAICLDREEWSMALSRNLDISRMSGSYGEPVNRPTPKVLDADGVEIRVGDTVYCDGDPEPLTVDSFDDPGCVYLTLDKNPNSMLYTVEPSRLSHERPDSWKRLLEDLDKGAVAAECSAELYCCDYFGADDCEACPASEVPFLCGKASFKDVADRIRALRGEVE